MSAITRTGLYVHAIKFRICPSYYIYVPARNRDICVYSAINRPLLPVATALSPGAPFIMGYEYIKSKMKRERESLPRLFFSALPLLELWRLSAAAPRRAIRRAEQCHGQHYWSREDGDAMQ